MQDEPEKSGQLVYDWDMRLIMNDEQLQTIEQIKQFLEGSEPRLCYLIGGETHPG